MTCRISCIPFLRRSSCWQPKGANQFAPSCLSLVSTLTDLSPNHFKRLPTLAPQPVPIKFPLVSNISSLMVSVNSFGYPFSSMDRVNLCVDVQTPAELKANASSTAV